MPGTMGAEDASINRLICPPCGSQSLLERKVELVGKGSKKCGCNEVKALLERTY